MILIALGANLPSQAGPPEATLRAALAALAREGVATRAVSQFFVTPAWPDPHDPPFVNAVAIVDTSLAPEALLARLHRVEEKFGRVRGRPNAPRPLDLDLIDYDGRVMQGPPLLPHPKIEERGFVLIPLADVAPDWRHPVSGRSLNTLIAFLPADQRNVQRLRE